MIVSGEPVFERGKPYELAFISFSEKNDTQQARYIGDSVHATTADANDAYRDFAFFNKQQGEDAITIVSARASIIITDGIKVEDINDVGRTSAGIDFFIDTVRPESRNIERWQELVKLLGGTN